MSDFVGGTHCAPGKGDEKSCYSLEQLKKIALNYNKDNKDKINLNLSRDHLMKELRDKLKPLCKEEACWANTEYGKIIPIEETFRPIRPESWTEQKRKWLNTDDISNVLKQYQEKYPDFEFIGPTPIDFDYKLSDNVCVLNDLCKFNMKQLLDKGKTKLGVVFNLDAHNQSGSHWVSMFSDFKKGHIYFFDSYGNKDKYSSQCKDNGCVPEISKLMNRIKNQGDKLCDDDSCSQVNNKFKIFINDNQHQYKDSECGMYSIYYITKFLEGKTFEEVSNDKISDDKVYQYRYKFFRPNNKETHNLIKEQRDSIELLRDKFNQENIEETDGSKYKDIIDPIHGDSYPTNSKKGKEILRNLVKSYLNLMKLKSNKTKKAKKIEFKV